MNALEQVTLNSVNLIDERLRLLQEELKEIEGKYGPMSEEKPDRKKEAAERRYQELPSLEPEAPKTVNLKPQIKEEYLRTLQYVPDIMSEYSQVKQEPQYINEALDLVIPPRAQADSSLLFEFLAMKVKEIV